MIDVGQICPLCERADLVWDDRFPTIPVVVCPSCRLVAAIEDRGPRG